MNKKVNKKVKDFMLKKMKMSTRNVKRIAKTTDKANMSVEMNAMK